MTTTTSQPAAGTNGLGREEKLAALRAELEDAKHALAQTDSERSRARIEADIERLEGRIDDFPQTA